MGLISAGINYRAQKLTNQTNLQIAQETNETNRQIAEMNNKANAEAAAQQNLWNIEQWNRENAYNDPAAQARRLMGAGLSGAAAAQAVNGGNASHLESANLAVNQTGAPMVAPHLDAPKMDFNLAQDALNIVNSLGGAANALKAFKEAQFTEDMIMTELDVKRWSINEAMQRYSQSEEKHPHSVRLLKAQADSAEWRSKADAYLPELNRIGLKAQKMNFQQSKFVFEHVNPMTIAKLGAEINAITQQTKNAEKIGEGIDLDNQGKALDNQGKRYDNAFKEAGLPESTAQRISSLVCKGLITPKQAVSLVKTGYNYVRSAGKVFNINPGLMPFYTMTVNPAYGDFMKLNPKILSGLTAPFVLDEISGMDTYPNGRFMSPSQKSKMDYFKATGQSPMGLNYNLDDDDLEWDDAVGK